MNLHAELTLLQSSKCLKLLRRFASERVNTACNQHFERRLAKVPTLVRNLGSPTVTQEHLLDRKSDPIRALASSQVTLGREVRSLKIRVSAVQPSRFAN